MTKKTKKHRAFRESIRAGLQKAGKKFLSKVVGIGGALLSTQKAHARSKKKQQYIDTKNDGSPLPKWKK
jgi:hypothetical protein